MGRITHTVSDVTQMRSTVVHNYIHDLGEVDSVSLGGSGIDFIEL